MEPTLAQIKEYVREKGIDVFKVLSLESDSSSRSLAFGDNQIEAYFQYYLEHSAEIVNWMNKTPINEDVVTFYR